MVIDYAGFTPLASLIGGAMIGLSALLLMAVNGRVMGVSGILGGIIRPAKNGGQQDGQSDISWRVLFLIGAVIGPFIVWYIQGEPIALTPVASGWMLPIAGFFVGIGTAIGAGCTSGHGICGLARLSLRSLAAVASFMVSAIIVVYIIRHVVA